MHRVLPVNNGKTGLSSSDRAIQTLGQTDGQMHSFHVYKSGNPVWLPWLCLLRCDQWEHSLANTSLEELTFNSANRIPVTKMNSVWLKFVCLLYNYFRIVPANQTHIGPEETHMKGIQQFRHLDNKINTDDRKKAKILCGI